MATNNNPNIDTPSEPVTPSARASKRFSEKARQYPHNLSAEECERLVAEVIGISGELVYEGNPDDKQPVLQLTPTPAGSFDIELLDERVRRDFENFMGLSPQQTSPFSSALDTEQTRFEHGRITHPHFRDPYPRMDIPGVSDYSFSESIRPPERNVPLINTQNYFYFNSPNGTGVIFKNDRLSEITSAYPELLGIAHQEGLQNTPNVPNHQNLGYPTNRTFVLMQGEDQKGPFQKDISQVGNWHLQCSSQPVVYNGAQYQIKLGSTQGGVGFEFSHQDYQDLKWGASIRTFEGPKTEKKEAEVRVGIQLNFGR